MANEVTQANGGAMKRAVLFVILMTASLSLSAGEPVTIRVSPAVTFAPACVRVQTTIEASADNRFIEIAAESEDFFRSSRIQLDGDRAARTNTFEFPNLPEGAYDVSATLFGSDGQPRGKGYQKLTVVTRGH